MNERIGRERKQGDQGENRPRCEAYDKYMSKVRYVSSTDLGENACGPEKTQHGLMQMQTAVPPVGCPVVSHYISKYFLDFRKSNSSSVDDDAL